MCIKMKNRLLIVIMTLISLCCFAFGIGAYNREIKAKAVTSTVEGLVVYTDAELAMYDVISVKDICGSTLRCEAYSRQPANGNTAAAATAIKRHLRLATAYSTAIRATATAYAPHASMYGSSTDEEGRDSICRKR